MDFVFRFFQSIFLLLFIVVAFLEFNGNTQNSHSSATWIMLAFFAVMVAMLEIIIRRRRQKPDSSTATTSTRFTPAQLELRYNRSFMILIVALAFLFLSIGYYAVHKGEITIILSMLLLLLLCLYVLRLWGKTILTIDSRGITHYKYGLIPWSQVFSVTQNTVKHRGMNVGKNITVILTRSLKPNRSDWMKSAEGILIANSSVLTIAVSKMNQPVELVYNTMQGYMKKAGVGVDALQAKSKHLDALQKEQEYLYENHATTKPAQHERLQREIDTTLSELQSMAGNLGLIAGQSYNDPELNRLTRQRDDLHEQQSALLDKMGELAKLVDAGKIAAADEPALVQKITHKIGKLNTQLEKITAQRNTRIAQLDRARMRRSNLLIMLVLALVLGGVVLLGYLKAT